MMGQITVGQAVRAVILCQAAVRGLAQDRNNTWSNCSKTWIGHSNTWIDRPQSSSRCGHIWSTSRIYSAA
ncbi:hypothetical protein WDU94_007833 [Cyamophila willieti]